MGLPALHIVNPTKAKILARVAQSSILATVHPDSATVAQVIRDALEATETTQEELSLAAGSRGKASQWCLGVNAPSLLHLVRLADAKPGLCEAILRGLLALCSRDPHVARPLPERVCRVLAEIGDVGREVHMAIADGVIDEHERRTMRREIQHAREQLDQLERDLDAQTGR
jgi:hypothetical protein